MPKILIYSFFLGISVNLMSQNHIGPKEDIDQILNKIETFSQHVMNGNYEAIAASYTADGKIFPNNLDILEGTTAIESYWKPREGYTTIHHKVTPLELKILGDEAYDYGYYEGRTKGPDGNESRWRGKYVITWKKIQGDWKIYLDIWNAIRAKE